MHKLEKNLLKLLKGSDNSEDLGIDGSWSKYSGGKRSIDPCVQCVILS